MDYLHAVNRLWSIKVMKVGVKFHRNLMCSFREEVASVCEETDGRMDDVLSHKLPGTTFQVS